jgi:hypothetical protein
MNSNVDLGFTWRLRLLDRYGRVIENETVHNLTPIEGLTYLMNAGFKGGQQGSSWYIALFEGNYTPTADITAATFPGLATECTAYESATRPLFNPGAVVAGSLDNSASLAEFKLTADKTIYGGVLTSASAKGAITGVITSAVRFSSPKNPESGSTLQVIAGNSLTST